ncbi:MAG: CHAT domain-containing protein [Pyrinomonadaceae bacterium]
MNRQELAENLLLAESRKERRTQLEMHREIADVKLAVIIKDLCQSAMTADPSRASKAALALGSLFKFNPEREIEAISLWVSGLADLTKGRLQSAVSHLQGSAGLFLLLGREHESAQPRIAALIAVAMLGEYDEALAIGAEGLRIFKKYGDELGAGKIEMNLSNVVARRELHSEAIQYCLSAQKRFAKLGEEKWLAMSQNDLARSYAQINDFRKAEKFYEKALASAQKAKLIVTQAEIEASMGNLALFRGRYAEALQFTERSRQKYQGLNMPHETAVAELEIADIYSGINLAEEAFEIYQNVIPSLKKLKMRREEALARANFGRSAALLKNPKLARREFAKADRLFAAQKNRTARWTIRLDLAFLELSEGNFVRLLELAEDALKTLGETENFRHQLMAEWLKAEAISRFGFAAKATGILRELLRKAVKTEQLNIVEASLNSLGRITMQSGDLQEASAYFKRAVKLVESSRAPFASEQFSRAFMAERLEPFENLARIHLSRGRIRDAFEVTETARSRTLLECLSGTVSKNPAAKALTDLELKANDLREELNWFYSRQTKAAGVELQQFQKEGYRIEKELAALSRRIGSTDASVKSAVGTHCVSLPQIQQRLGTEKAIIEYVKFEGMFSAFVVTNRKIQFFENLASAADIDGMMESLQFQFNSVRYGGRFTVKFGSQLKSRTDAQLEKLYEKLVKPLEQHFRQHDLIIVPAASLHYVPFHALYDGLNYLIESREIIYSPSASVWHRLAERTKFKPKSVLLIGYADENIPLVDHEIAELKSIFPKSKSMTGADATFTAFLDNASKFDILHLACHGQFRPENPMFSSLHLADGWVTVQDMQAQRLCAEIVTLSACETGMNSIFAGEELLGLARGFLSAGAGSMLLSLWKVNDEAAVSLMKSFYENLHRGGSPAASLRIAQTEFIRRLAHPYLWAPFVFIGS